MKVSLTSITILAFSAHSSLAWSNQILRPYAQQQDMKCRDMHAYSSLSPVKNSLLLININAKNHALPDLASSLLYGGTGVTGYAIGLQKACTLPALSQGWIFALPMLVLASYAIARSILPYTKISRRGINISDDVFARNFGAHLFSATAIPILTSFMLRIPLFHQVQQRSVLFFSMAILMMGSISENIAHFRDGWVYTKGCKARDGLENVVFNIGLCGAFSFLSAAFSPSLSTLFLASIPPCFLTYLSATKHWHEVRVPITITQTITTIIPCAIFANQFRSAWPLLFFTQAFNIVRSSSRIIASENQNLHILPSAYGWFSYVFPFALTLHPATQAASLLTVLASCALTIIGSDLLERRIINHGLHRCVG